MIKNKGIHLAAAGLAILCHFATAADQPEQQTQATNLTYVGSNGRMGIGYDTQTKLRGEAYWVFSEESHSAWIAEGWGSGLAGGLKLNYHWAPEAGREKAASQDIHKLFVAIDQNDQRYRKLTLGGGLERENLFIGASLSAALSGRRTINDTTSTVTDTIFGTEQGGRQYSQDVLTSTNLRLYERPYDYGVGARVGRYFNESLFRLSGGLDYEWGRDSSHQTTLSVVLEKFIANSPHSFSVNAEVHQKSGPLEQNRDDRRLYVMYRYDLGGKSHRPEREYRLVEAPANTAGRPAEENVSPASPATPAESKPKTEKRMVKTTAAMLSDAFFEFDSDKLTSEAKKALNSVIDILRKTGYSGNILLTGHTCDIGPAQYNLKLSEHRALSVKKFLAETGGVPPDVMIAEGKGKSMPRFPNVKESRYKNRRVDLEFVTFTEKLEDVVLPSEPVRTEAAKPAKSAKLAAKVEWIREYIDTEPAWLRRALHNTTPHKQSVDVYRQQEREVKVTISDKHYINHAPSALNDAFSINQDTTSLLDVLANDSDPDGDPLKITSITAPAHGSTSVSGGKVSYTPAAGFIGVDNFAYTIADDKGATSTARATITVKSTNRPPIAVDDRFTVQVSSSSVLNVLANDSDPDGDPLTIVSFTQPAIGAILRGSNGNLVFSPAGGFVSTSFSYTISDGKGDTASATVTLIDP